MEWIQALDEAAIVWIQNNLRCDFLDGIVPAITKLGDGGIIWIILALLLLVAGKKFRKAGLATGLSLAFSGLFCNLLIKPMVARTRPYDLLEIEMLVERLSDYSFPSGHTSAAFAFAFGLFMVNRKYGVIALIAAGIMGLTRLYLCVHFPTDVLGGAVLGIFCGFLGGTLAKKIYEKIENRK